MGPRGARKEVGTTRLNPARVPKPWTWTARVPLDPARYGIEHFSVWGREVALDRRGDRLSQPGIQETLYGAPPEHCDTYIAQELLTRRATQDLSEGVSSAGFSGKRMPRKKWCLHSQKTKKNS